MLFFPHNFAVPMRVVGGVLVHEFLISYSRTGWYFQVRAWVLHFQRLCSWSIVYEFHHFAICMPSSFYISCLLILWKVCVTYMCSNKSIALLCACEFILYEFHIWSVDDSIFDFSCDVYSLEILVYLVTKNSVRLIVHFAMVYLMMHILWRVCMTRSTMTKYCHCLCMNFIIFCLCMNFIISCLCMNFIISCLCMNFIISCLCMNSCLCMIHTCLCMNFTIWSTDESLFDIILKCLFYKCLCNICAVCFLLLFPWFLIFLLFKSILFFVNWISLYFFHII